MLKRILHWIKPLDWVIMITGGILVFGMDFSNMTFIDVIYLTSFIMWLGMLLIRFYLMRKRGERF